MDNSENSSKKLPSNIEKLAQSIFDKELKSVSSSFYRLSGYDFLHYISKLCTKLMDVDFVYISEYNSESNKIITRTSIVKGKSVDNTEIDIDNTPVRHLLKTDFYWCSKNIGENFRNDQLLKKYDIQGFAGVPLLNNAGNVFGMFYIYSGNEISNIELIESNLRLFSGRISAELNLIKKEEQLIKSEKKYQTLFESADDAINIIKGVEYVDCNSKTLEIFGCKNKNEFIGKTVLDFSPEKQPDGSLSKDKAWYLINETLKGIPQRFYWRHNRKDKTEFDTEVSLNPLQIGGATYFQAVVRDIMQQKNSLELEQKLSTAVEQSSASIVITNIVGEIEYVNPKFTEITGYTLDEVSGKKPNVLKSGYTSDEEYSSLWNTILAGKVWNDEFKNIKKNGEFYWETASIAPITNEFGEITHFVAIKDDITERKNVESLLKKSEERYHSIFENLHDVLYITDLNGTILELSPSIGFHFGYDREKLLGTSVYDVYYDVNEREKFLNIIKREGIVNDYEIALRNEFGDKVYCSANARLVFDENGIPKQVEGILRNITDRKLNEKKLRLSEERFRKVQKVAKIGTFEHDIKDGIYWASDETKNIFGFSLTTEKIPVTLVRECFVDREKTSTVLDDAFKNLDSYNIEFDIYQFESNERKTVNSIAEIIRDKEGNPLKVLGIIADITEKKRIEKDLISAKERAEESEHFYRTMNENLPLGMHHYKLDNNGKLIFTGANPAADKILGINHSQIIGKSIEEAFPPLAQTEVTERYRDAAANGISWRTEQINYNHGEIAGAFEVVAYQTTPGNMVAIFSDITARKQAEQEVIKAKDKAEESDKLKTAFLLNVSHEIRTPMNGILGFLNLLKQPELSDIQKSDYLEIVNKSGERLMNTINDIVEISKIETGDINLVIQEIDITEMMQYHLNFFKFEAENKGLKLSIKKQIAGDKVIIKTDKHKLDGILMNLIKNAIKFTNKGTIEIGNYHEDDKLFFYVSDTGQGIQKNKLDVIFERFVQADTGLSRKYEGSGIGLSIVKAHVESLNGKISVKSEVGRGSTFLFSIPYNPVKMISEQKQSEKSTKLSSDDIIILIAEDDEVNYYLMEKMLSNNYKLIHAVNGEESIQLLKENPNISLILMDIKMPGKFDGLETTGIIRKFNKQIPIIAQSAYAQNSDKIAAIDAGCNDYISKPFNANQLKSIISKYCNKK